jgi:crotonobetainyl-CoA:carnitine CoA-transferase CaiB-like acyl-CoA transferase
MAANLPLAGLRVVELSHMVMGPSCGLIFADLGAEVIKVEPPDGDNTRRLTGSGAGFFAAFNRNKKSLALDLKREEGRALLARLLASADVLIENFRPGALDAMGFGYEAVRAVRPDIVYVSLKGFLAGPYENRTALDEVVQMMGGLAYMTGLPGRPLRAGASVNDIMGGMFGAIAALAALRERQSTGQGRHVTSGLFENCAFLVSQHMMQAAITGQAPAPMSQRSPAWGVYDIFDTADERQLFVAVVTDTQWRAFCARFGLADLGADASLASNAQRVAARSRTLPLISQSLARLTQDELVAACDACGLPYAPINRPEDLFDDPHLNAGGMAAITLPGDAPTCVPALPMAFDGIRFGTRHDLPAIGADSDAVLAGLGCSPDEIAALIDSGVVRSAAASLPPLPRPPRS